jgi:hypothetical protein
MPSFETLSSIARSPEATFSHLVDLGQWPSFRGFGPLPGIVSAERVGGGPVELGARIRVTNTDGSVHHEIVEEFAPARLFRVRMELSRPASAILARIDERVELEPHGAGTRLRRRFDVTPRSIFTAPLAWFIARVLLRRAVLAHDRAVASALEERGGAA